ncbi:phage tail protein I [Dechloromonas denitrificans]|uniref:phage tail protein I n=1 Tax=Dechloromonas denitrificans TaxID=281362 RepID=UPI001CF81AEF|nr:phage tail protein I [Dechloromonas denitrificans]UCV02305.1 phage tail protein I [Dechloromonas denitrificans]
MNQPATLLPPSSTPLERAIDRTGAARLAAQPAIIGGLWNAATCPVDLLPYLAWAVSVDEWDNLWSEEKKRAIIAEAPEIHRTKGTPSAIRRALAALGQPDAEITERTDYIRCDGSVICDGSHTCGGRWATYRIRLFQPLTVGDAQLIKRTLEAVGRLSTQMLSLDFSAAAFRCDGSITCNGDYSCGAVDTTIN